MRWLEPITRTAFRTELRRLTLDGGALGLNVSHREYAMKLFVITSVGLLLFGVPSAPDEIDGLGPLQGVWHLVATADAGRTDRGSADCTMTIRGDGRVVLRL